MNRREAGLRGVLVRSHLGVAGLGVLALVLTLMAITLLRARTSRLARESGPAAVAALETQEGLMESLAALRGWMSIDDPAFLEARTQAWDGVVWPAFQTLKQQAGDDGRLDALRNDLRDLEEWQWHIEQVAQSEGNEPARRRLLVQIDPVVSHVLSATTALMALEADGDQRYTHLQVLADLRAAVATSRSALGDFVIVGDQSMRLDFERLLAEATSLALVVAREGGASTAHADQLALLDQEFRAYAALSESVVRLRASSGWNVAHELLRTEAAPLAERAARLAGAIVDDHRAAMRRDAGYVDRVATAVMIAVVALLIGLVLVASWLAVRRAGAIAGPIKVLAEASVGLAEGRVAEDLPVTTRDEVGALTKTFNEMRRTLVERDQALRAHQAELTDTNAALEAQNRIQTAVNQLDDLMRGDQEVETLGDNVLGFLASWFDADVGAMYLPTGETLEYVAGYAFAPDEAARSIPVNAGLPGQAARRKTPILIETPAGHLPLSSATGQSETAHLLVVPIVNEDELFGVVELGSFAPIDSERMELLRIVMPSIAIHVRAAESRARLRELLDTTREQADALEAKQEALQAANEELRVQQEELRQSNEELEDQSNRLRESERRLQAQQEELRQSNEELLDQKRQVEHQAAVVQQQNRELQTAQQELHDRAADLALASRYKSEFLANMSHELRTPLNSMLLLSKLMSDDRDGNLTDRQIEWAETMHSAGNDLLELINDILDLSKVEAGKLAITPEQVRLEELAASIERAFAHVAEDRGLGLDVAITAAAPREISSDARRIEQILKNLLSNAFKFTEVGGVRVELDAHPTGVAIAVIDSGPGIPVAQQRAIFEAFQQADGTISRRFGGTGLGLTISRALTELLGGTLELESEVGVGTTFRLVLPKQLEAPAPQPRAEAVEPAPIPDPPAAPYVLVIEDDVNFADTLAQMVRKRGLACCVTTTGQAGLAVQRQRRPIGVLLDWRLPDMSGREVLSAMRAERALWDVPVHVITGLDPDQVHTPAPVLTKPVAETDVAAAVQAFVDGEQTARVLVVDDHADQQLAIAGLLEGVDAAIVQVASGAEALQAIEDGPFDCVILDLGLPDMSGFELLEQIESIPVIVHTARELTAAEEVQLRRRAKSIIVKGQTPHERLLEDVQLFVRRIDEQREATAPAPVEAELDGHTVLVVDDDIRNVYALSASLEAAGVSVVMARDGQEALDRVRQNDAIDLVLMDVMMPVMDGLEATRRIRSELEKDRLPIIAVTAKAMPGDADQCLEAGADDYLPKPIDTDRLLSTVRAWLSGRPA